MFNGILDLIQLITNRLPHPPADIALRDPLARGQVAKGLLSFADTLARFQLMAGHIEHEANYLIRCHERGDFAKRAIENYDTSINNYHQENADLLRALFLAYKVQMLPPIAAHHDIPSGAIWPRLTPSYWISSTATLALNFKTSMDLAPATMNLARYNEGMSL